MYIQRYKIKTIPKSIEGEGYEIIDDERVIFVKASLNDAELSSKLLNDSIERISRILCNRKNVIGVVVKEGQPTAYDGKSFEEVN